MSPGEACYLGLFVSLTKRVHMIHFVNNIEEIPEYPLSRTILIDDSLQSADEVIDKIEKALDAPYDNDNWDGFWDVLRDLQWLKESQVVLIHKSLPRLPAWNLHIYLDILNDASSLWADKDRWLKKRRAFMCLADAELARPANSYNYIDFQVYFLADDKAKFEYFLSNEFLPPKAAIGTRPADKKRSLIPPFLIKLWSNLVGSK